MSEPYEPEILEEWPAMKEEPSPLLKYMDGRIYQFTSEDAERLGYIEKVDCSGWTPEDHARNRYVEANGLFVLKNDLMLVARTAHGPWQARTVTLKNGAEVVFQFTGLRDCRTTDCTTQAAPECNGFCKEHDSLRRNQ